MKRILLAVAIFLASLTSETAHAAFGRDQPIYNVVDAAFLPTSGKTPSESAVKSAIIQAATARKWTVREEAPGHLIATLDVRQHQAVINIKYTTKTFSITYRDSRVLRYNGTTIHRNYNKWIKLLQQDISEKLALV